MKLFITDLDGTLVERNNLSNENLEGVKRLKEDGVIFGVATGRPYNSCRFLKDEYDIDVDYFVLLNGGLIIGKDGKVVHHKGISYNIVNSIVEEVKNDGAIIALETGYTTYVVQGKYETSIEWSGLIYTDLQKIKDEKLSLISIYFPNESIEKVDEVCRSINEKYLGDIIAYRNTKFIDVVPLGCSKGEGIKYIKEKESIDFNDIYTIGDSWNDISMFKEGKNSFTFPTSEEGIKKEAKHIVESVAEAINEYCLK